MIIMGEKCWVNDSFVLFFVVFLGLGLSLFSALVIELLQNLGFYSYIRFPAFICESQYKFAMWPKLILVSAY
jgi:hypothetical protein